MSDLGLTIDVLPPMCGVEIAQDWSSVRAFSEALPGTRLLSDWRPMPADRRIRWAEFDWPND